MAKLQFGQRAITITKTVRLTSRVVREFTRRNAVPVVVGR